MSVYNVGFKITAIDHLSKMFSKVDRLNVVAQSQFEKTNQKIRKNSRSVSGLISKLNVLKPKLSLGNVVGIAAAGTAIKSVVNTLAEMEKYEAVLGNTLGSDSAARKSLIEISKFASKTPFQVNQLTDSFVKLANQGFIPNMSEMTKLGDLASSTGKGIGQLSEAILDAKVMEFERLKEFGIKARNNGKSIQFTFKGITSEVANNSQAIQDYILSLGSMKGVTGAMDKISKTTGGVLSNLGDKWLMLKWRLGEANKWLFEIASKGLSKAIDKLSVIVDWTEKHKDVLQKYVTNGLNYVYNVGLKVWTVFEFFFDIIRVSVKWINQNQKVVGQWINVLAKAAFWAGVLKLTFMTYNTAFAGMVKLTAIIKALRSGTLLATISQWKLNFALTANPIGALVTTILVVVPLLVALASKFDWVRDRIWDLVSLVLKYNPFTAIILPFPKIRKAVFEFIDDLKEHFDAFFKWVGGLIDLIPGQIKNALGIKDIEFSSNQKRKKDNSSEEDNGFPDYQGLPDMPKGSASPVQSRINGISAQGSGNIKNIKIDIGKLVEQLVIKSDTVEMSEAKIKSMMTKVLLGVVNDVNYAN